MNGLLHMDNLVVALLYAFYNPTCRSLRTLEGLGKVCSQRAKTAQNNVLLHFQTGNRCAALCAPQRYAEQGDAL